MLKSLKLLIILFFGLFILISLSIVTFSSIPIVKDTANYLASSKCIPVIENAVNYIDGNKFEQLCKTLDEEDPFTKKHAHIYST